ncbi:D-alanyl-D-alanine carboxypeptidase family protein [Actinomadura terrae]|uniref:D-alanyl-D-alanine carboxypeptidase family protein n=1 Tax=Actinomadura terrae TaxID=604353 RepID=UPI001FA6F72C|nr:D-alanyl-D-alanine carboxypeptidase [Actinomadura terrae]
MDDAQREPETAEQAEGPDSTDSPDRMNTAEFALPKPPEPPAEASEPSETPEAEPESEPEEDEEIRAERERKKAASLTRPDISVRRNPDATVFDMSSQQTREEPRPETPAAPRPETPAAPPPEPPGAPADVPQGPWEAAPPPSAPSTPPAPPPQPAPPAPPAPGTRSSGQWTVPWETAEPEPAPPSSALVPAPQPVPLRETPVTTPPVAERRPRRKRRVLIIALAAAVLVAGVVAGQLIRPAPDPTLKMTLSASTHTFPGAAPALPWPAQGQSVVHVEGLGTMGASGGSAPTPTASVAKVMTAYVYLRDHPLRTGEPGPMLTVSPQAAAQIPMRRQRQESLLGVTANQRLTQRKALEALMIISANDVAHELARWDAGDERAFVAKMNATARGLGMTSTTYTDPSGYDSRTVSTAADQVKLLSAAMRVPAFGEIVNHPAYVPDGGGAPRPGGNILLGQYGVVGGKTGYTDAAGGNFVFAARKRVGGVPTLIVGAVMAQRSPSAMGAVTAGQQLVAAAEGALTAATLAPANAAVAKIDDGLGGGVPARAASAVTVVGWPGLSVPVVVGGDPPTTGKRGDKVGVLTAGAARVPLVLGGPLDAPSPLKRLTRLS